MKMPDIELLDASVDEQDTSELRLLVDHKHVKYITVDAGIYDVETMCFAPSLIPVLPHLPPGNWNQGHISRNPIDGCPYFARTAVAQLPGITHAWHPHRIDHLAFQMHDKLRSNVFQATCPHFPQKVVVVKIARFPHEIAWLDRETQVYEWMAGHDIAPAFLAHVTEKERIIGFVIEHVAHAIHAGPDHLWPCQEVLRKLHCMGIKHGDTNKHNFLVTDGVARLIDLDNAVQCRDLNALDDEMASLQRELKETTGRGRGGIVRGDGDDQNGILVSTDNITDSRP